MVNTQNVSASVQNYYANKPQQELQKDLDQAVKMGNYVGADLIMNELKSRQWLQNKLHAAESFDKKIEDFKISLAGLSENEKHQKLRAFFENDLKRYQAQVKNEYIPAMKARE